MQKRRVLVISAPLDSSTSYAVVAKKICNSLHATGRYDLEVVGLDAGDDANSERVEKEKCPYRVIDGNREDIFSAELIGKKLMNEQFDIVLGIHDLYTYEGLSFVADLVRQYGRQFRTVCYAPVQNARDFPKNLACVCKYDYPVAFTQFGYGVLVQAFPELAQKLSVIYHGCEPTTFYALPARNKRVIRANLNATDDTFVVLNVNRNTIRKDLPRTLKIFDAFQRCHRESKLHLHAKEIDVGGNLTEQAAAMGLQPVSCLRGTALPRSAMNDVYNAGDVVVSTTLGEGWGLTCTEAMVCKIPVIFPRHTSLVEIIGANEERGYLADCAANEDAWCTLEDLPWPLTNQRSMLEKLEQVYADRRGLEYVGKTRDKIEAAYEWAMQHTWRKIGQQWVELFDSIL